MVEKWKQIESLDYEISNLGRVRNKDGHIMQFRIIGINISVILYDKYKQKYRGFTISKLLKKYFNKTNIDNLVKPLDGEIWKDIKGFEGLYMISNYGRIKAINYGTHYKTQLLKQRTDKKGVYCVDISKNNTKFNKTVHRLVAKHFIPNPYKKPQVIHINGDKSDNKVNNLKWVNNSENQRNVIKLGLRYIPQGKEVHNHRSVHQLNMNLNIIKSWDTITEASKKLEIPTTNISKVCKGQRNTAGGYVWMYVDENPVYQYQENKK